MGIEAIRAFFSGRAASDRGERRIDPVTIAACALLLEIAHADDVFGPDELERIGHHVRVEMGVQEEEMRKVLEAAEEERRESVDLYQFTRLLEDHLSREQRRRLVETIWEVVYADGRLSLVENHLARRIAELLGFQHPEVQEIKDRVAARYS